jgi:hypothetical protein
MADQLARSESENAKLKSEFAEVLKINSDYETKALNVAAPKKQEEASKTASRESKPAKCI